MTPACPPGGVGRTIAPWSFAVAVRTRGELMGASKGRTIVSRAGGATPRAGGAALAALAVAFLLSAAGCQTAKSGVTYRKLISHRALVDFSGLKPVEAVPSVKVDM